MSGTARGSTMNDPAIWTTFFNDIGMTKRITDTHKDMKIDSALLLIIANNDERVLVTMMTPSESSAIDPATMQKIEAMLLLGLESVRKNIADTPTLN